MRARVASLPLAAVALAVGVACASGPSAPGPARSTAAPGDAGVAPGAALALPRADDPRPMPPGLDAAAMDLAANPCQDFYQYACGGWMKATPVPPDRSRWVRSFDTIREKNQATLRDILEATAAGKPPAGTRYAKQLGDYYASCMDASKLAAGVPVLRAELRRIDRLRGGPDLAATVARMQRAGARVFFELASTQDAKEATRVIAGVDQGGLGLPDRDYYLSEAPRMKDAREGYRAYVAQLFRLLGETPEAAARRAEQVLDVETELAKASLDRVSRRDPDKTYHPMAAAGVRELAPAFDWTRYLGDVGAPATDRFDVSHPPFLTAVSQLVRAPLSPRVRTYLGWRLLTAQVQALPAPFQEAAFAFDSKYLSGAKEDLPRWKKCVQLTDGALGEALAVPFVEKTFGPDGKAMAKQLVSGIEEAFEANLGDLAWMDDATKQKAVAKSRQVFEKVGYPDAWKTYDGLRTDRRSFLGNWQRASAYEMARDLKRIGKPLDRGRWRMTPPTVNAYYSAQLNEMVFPAGILQPPFFERTAAEPVNYGAIGYVVGHELTHGFDDQGRKFDAAGNLTDWWSPESARAYTERAACVKTQYDGYEVLDDVRLNGALTLGENIADLGGMKLAFLAMQARARAHPETRVTGTRYTAEQQFFLGSAQTWCANIRPEEARRRATVDTHSASRWRVNGPMSNLPQFQAAFGCKAGDAMVRAQRCEVW